MKTPLPSLLAAHKVVTAVVAGAVLVTGAGVAFAATRDSAQVASVVRVVDGDTLDVTYGGQMHRVRLLNIDSPETVDPDEPVGCMGPEAFAFLNDRLPAGTTIELLFDNERTDRYDRILAGVMLDGALVNAEVARAGFGVAVLYQPNRRFYDEVLAAEEQARQAGLGVHDETAACTLPAQIEAFSETVTAAAAAALTSPTDVASLESHMTTLVAVYGAGVAIDHLLDRPDVFPALALRQDRLVIARNTLTAAMRRLSAAKAGVTEAHIAELNRLESERLAVIEAARVAAVQAARVAAVEVARVAAEAESARVAAAATAARLSADAAAARAAASAGSGGGLGGGSDDYTGCRAYAPGGGSYTRIPCP